MLKYAQMLEDGPMLQVNTAAIVLNSIYTSIYFIYSCDRWNEVFKPMLYGASLIALMFGYVCWEDPGLVEWRYGFIVTALMLLVMAAPLLDIV